MRKFKNTGYEIVKEVISNELCDFLDQSFKLQRQATQIMTERKLLFPYDESHGYFNDKQVEGAFSFYGCPNFEVLLKAIKPIVEKITNIKLVDNYSYARIYEKGHELKKHIDRPSCEISTTLNIGGSIWPIYLQNPKNNKPIKIELNHGDMLIYRGCDYTHWREPLDAEYCSQVFLHYNNLKNSPSPYDGRPILGLPFAFKEK